MAIKIRRGKKEQAVCFTLDNKFGRQAKREMPLGLVGIGTYFKLLYIESYSIDFTSILSQIETNCLWLLNFSHDTFWLQAIVFC